MELVKEYGREEFMNMVEERTPKVSEKAISKKLEVPMLFQIKDKEGFKQTSEFCDDIKEYADVFIPVAETNKVYELSDFPERFKEAINFYDFKAQEDLETKAGKKVREATLPIHVGGFNLILLVDINDENIEDIKELHRSKFNVSRRGR